MPSEQSKLLLEHYLEYQRREQKTITAREFSKHLGIHETTLSLLMNDKEKISNQMAARLGKKTGDYRFYDLNQLPHPDPLYGYITSEWKHLTDEQKRAIKEQVAEYRMDSKND